ncbi:hypothetical protein BOTBODRAFT_35311 [Botryobasidium botryosum FD-172 SS1]|uniref:Uncharacterized protein n=1 Tax=Botryobasidium botryosum (strain FD-172 SS1) TaxID=930990 RepID=A0A067MIP0_BOTB1|nr:hypothetical protein BOTBODRAFT_35311 [Botryobasidium botryosum FD-172 SS1]
MGATRGTSATAFGRFAIVCCAATIQLVLPGSNPHVHTVCAKLGYLGAMLLWRYSLAELSEAEADRQFRILKTPERGRNCSRV